jgi:hypothetical protein
MAGSDIRINIIGAFQKKGFNDADKAFNKLQLSAKKLGRTLGLTFSAAAIAAYSKKSIAAANADIKSQRILAQSLKNVGLAYAATDAEGFIERLERQTGILDDELRPAFAQLAQITGSVAQSQKLLSLAFDVSAGSGKDINSVVDILTRAYLGNRRGLKALNLAYTDAELKAMDFSEVLGILTAQYAGSGGASLEGFEGKMRKLNVASSRAAETIGKSLINAIGTLSKDDSIDTTVTKMDNLSKAIGRNIEAVADLIAEIQKIPGAGVIGNAIGAIENRISFFSPSNFMNLLSQVRGFQGMGNVSISKSSQDLQKSIIKSEKAAMDAANKRQKAILASLKKEEDARKKREALEKARKRAATIFDMENIQIVAALQGKIDGEQRARLVALLALNTENYKAAEKLADVVIRLNEPALNALGVMIEAGDSVDDLVKKLITSQAKLAALQLTAEDFPELDNPFEEWENSLERILEMLMMLLGMNGTTMAGGVTSIKRPKQPAFGPGSGASDVEWMRMMDAMAKAGVPYVADNQSSLMSPVNQLATARYEAMQRNVNVYVQGSVTTERDLVKSITDSLYETQRQGQSIILSSTGL